MGNEIKGPPLNAHWTFILANIGLDGISGVELRKQLRDNGRKTTTATFSHTMGVIERQGLVRSEHTTSVVDGHAVRGKSFELTAEGKRALDETALYYGNLFKKVHVNCP